MVHHINLLKAWRWPGSVLLAALKIISENPSPELPKIYDIVLILWVTDEMVTIPNG